ncbi:MAG: hypothetical protein WC249_01075 [Patescibacteria group bacterium]|jgi:tetratricopeptide (TPR) repeat protein
MFNLISIILIILSALIILTIIVKKFPALALLDVVNIPGEKEVKFKHKIIKARVERDLARWSGFFGRAWLFIHQRLVIFLQARQAGLKKIKASYAINIKVPWLERQKRIRELAVSVKESLKKEDENSAEEKLMEIISLDQKNLEAFFRLGSLYAGQKKLSEARQTYEYALKLAKQRDQADLVGDITLQEIYFSMAEMEREEDNFEEALENIREALELEPNSPRYLDLILDLSIIKKDKNLAQEYWNKLAAVNPENNKLPEWQKKIEKL